LKRATKRAIAHSLFSKEPQKSDCSFALLQRATKRAIAHSLFFKERLSKRSHNCSFEKSGNERRANERLPNLKIFCPWFFLDLNTPLAHAVSSPLKPLKRLKFEVQKIRLPGVCSFRKKTIFPKLGRSLNFFYETLI